MALPPNVKKDYLTSGQIAKRYSIKEKSVRRQRMQDRGPPHVKFGGRIFYKITEVEAWERAQLKPKKSPVARGKKRR